MRLFNDYRTENGVGIVENHDVLQAASEIRAPELVENFDHTRPNGNSYMEAVSEANKELTGVWGLGDLSSAGENIASQFALGGIISGKQLAEKLFENWKNSLGLNAIMLNGNRDYMVLGLYVDG
ncbi:CAP domain-containing protein [Enterococcus sp. CWB-B31]|uniref:CAP domain-containing protein n=1 Tax=Enterococcus sp. CWB-B31 TaxID=2885159 RepID=UPI001E4B5BBB|nr:CAP domain-containing protein [Enterococcus sp. CWB-B31]MCB5956370.1 CAP domain-containing protein [Enterococcus sp. CWB-B31]